MKRIFSFEDEELKFTPEKVSLEQFNRAFCARTEELRLQAGHTDIQIFANLMGMTARQYAVYEANTPLPHSLIPYFCEKTHSIIIELFNARIE